MAQFEGQDYKLLYSSLFTDNWDSSNTSNFIPEIRSILESKSYNYNFNASVIFLNDARVVRRPAGIGASRKNLQVRVDIDVRSKLPRTEEEFNLVVKETLRIIDANQTNPFSTIFTDVNHIQEIEEVVNLSDQTHQLFRSVITILLTLPGTTVP